MPHPANTPIVAIHINGRAFQFNLDHHSQWSINLTIDPASWEEESHHKRGIKQYHDIEEFEIPGVNIKMKRVNPVEGADKVETCEKASQVAKATQVETTSHVDKAIQTTEVNQLDRGVQADSGLFVQVDRGVQAEQNIQVDRGVQADENIQADKGVEVNEVGSGGQSSPSHSSGGSTVSSDDL